MMSRPASSRPVLGRRRLPWLLALAVATGCAGGSQAPSAVPEAPALRAPEPLALDPAVRHGVLPNGLSYYLRRHEPEKKRVHLQLVIKAGSLYEEDEQRGIAHFVEHMAFNGTKRFEKQSLVDFFERAGMTFGAHANATTTYDRTAYQLSLPSDDPGVVDKGIDVIEDWASGIRFDPAEVESERQVVLSEWTAQRGVARRVGEQMRRFLLLGSRHVTREVIGDEHVLQSATPEQLATFYHTWYRPERMAVVAVGDIDPEALSKTLTERLVGLGGRYPRQAVPDATIPSAGRARAAVISDPEVTTTTVNVAFKAPSRPLVTDLDYRRRVLDSIAATILERRLRALSADSESPFTRATCGFSPDLLGAIDLFGVSAQVKEGEPLASLEALLVELARVERHGFTEAEVARELQDYARNLERRVEIERTRDGRVLAAELAGAFVRGSVVPSAELVQSLGQRLIGEITAAEVSAVAREWLREREALLSVSGPARDQLPKDEQMLALQRDVGARAVEPYVEPGPAAELMASLPEPGRVVAEEHVPELDVTVWTLSNGARVVLKPTDFAADQILGRAVSLGGHARASREDFESARFAAQIVDASGLGSLDRQAVERRLSGKVAGAAPWITEQEEGFDASAAPRDAEAMFQLLHLYATAPRKDESAFAQLAATLREQLKNRDLSPEAAFADAVSKALWGDDPRRSAPTLESVERIELERALAFYRDRFRDVSDFYFVFVGRIDKATFKPLVERYLASLPGGERKETATELGLHLKKGIVRVKVERGQEDKATWTRVYHGETPWSDPAHTDLVSLQSYLSIRLREVLREELGAVYTPHVGSQFDRVPHDAWLLSISLTCKPEDLPKVERATAQVIAELKKSGPDPAYLEKMQSQRTRSLEEEYRTNGFWLGRLASKYVRGEDPKTILDLHELTARITKENLVKAAKTYLRDDQYLDARLLPAPR